MATLPLVSDSFQQQAEAVGTCRFMGSWMSNLSSRFQQHTNRAQGKQFIQNFSQWKFRSDSRNPPTLIVMTFHWHTQKHTDTLIRFLRKRDFTTHQSAIYPFESRASTPTHLLVNNDLGISLLVSAEYTITLTSYNYPQCWFTFRVPAVIIKLFLNKALMWWHYSN